MAIFTSIPDHLIEAYHAVASPSVEAATGTTPFTIEVRFLGGLTDGQKAAFATAADRWVRVIVGDLPPAEVDGELIDDILILAQGADIDGVGGILGQAGPTRLRSAAAGAAAFLPAKGEMQFDIADLDRMEADGTLDDVIAHEMGHVLGVGTLWAQKGLIVGLGRDPEFTGEGAATEFGLLLGQGPTRVPVEDRFGPGTINSHWRERVFQTELMSGFIGAGGNPLSRMTAASLGDMGYVVDLGAAEPYRLPAEVEAGVAVARGVNALDAGRILPRIPIVLPG